MSIKYDRILIDANSVGYAAHSGQPLTAKGGQIQAVFYSMSMMRKAIERFSTKGVTHISALWDTHATWRYDLHPEYKGKRDDDPVKRASRLEYKRQVPIIRKAINCLGIEQRFAKNEEADDLSGALVHNRKPGEKILLVSGDHDWLQLVTADVHWYDPRGEGLFVDQSNFEAVTKCKNASQFVQAKAILGDSSDNIKGVEGLGEKAVPLIFENWGSVTKLIEWANSSIETGEFMRGDLPDSLSRWRNPMSRFVFGDGLAVFKRNVRLMNLLSPHHRGQDILDKQVILPGKFEETVFVDFCHEYAFMSFVSAANLKNWLKIFG